MIDYIQLQTIIHKSQLFINSIIEHVKILRVNAINIQYICKNVLIVSNLNY